MTRLRVLVCLGILFHTATSASAQDIGKIVATEGVAEIGRNDSWRTASLGDPIKVGDELRTGAGRIHALIDPSGEGLVDVAGVLVIGDDSRLLVQEVIYDPDPVVDSTLSPTRVGQAVKDVSQAAVHFKARWATTKAPGWLKSWRILIPPAAVRGKGTECIVWYSGPDGVTTVIAMLGEVSVETAHGRSTPLGQGMRTTVANGDRAAPPTRLGATELSQLRQPLEFVGGGRLEGLSSPLLSGTSMIVADLPKPRRSARLPQNPGERSDEGQDVSTIVGSSPPVLETQGGEVEIRLR